MSRKLAEYPVQYTEINLKGPRPLQLTSSWQHDGQCDLQKIRLRLFDVEFFLTIFLKYQSNDYPVTSQGLIHSENIQMLEIEPATNRIFGH